MMKFFKKILQTNFLESPVGKTLFLKSLPMFIGILASIAYNFVDTYFVAQLGTDELAAISFCFPVVMISLNLVMGIATAVTSLSSRAIGEGDHEKANRVSEKGLFLTLIFSLGVSLLGMLTIETLFTFLGANSSLIPLIRDYMSTWYLGALFINLPMVGMSIFRARGEVFFPSAILFLGALFNAILDPVLIFGLGPIPAMGMQGAALTTVLGNALSFYFIFRKLKAKEGLTIPLKIRGMIPSLFKPILIIAIPTALANSFTPVSTAFTNWLLSFYGSAAVAANSIATRVEMLPFIAIFALTTVISPFIGQNWGAKSWGRVREGIKKSFLFSHILGILTAALLFFYHDRVTALFDNSESVIAITTGYFTLVPITYGLLGTIFLTSHMLNAVGKPFVGNFFSAARLLIIYIPLAFLLNTSHGVEGIFQARFIANISIGIISSIITYRIFFKGTREKELLEEQV